MNKRHLKLEKYGITGKRYKELSGFCEQYPDWKRELANYSYVSAVQYKQTPGSPNKGESDPTSRAAIRLAMYEHNCQLIERVAKMASEEFWEYIIKSVCYEVPTLYLIQMDGMCIERSAFYERRRYFFYLLDEEKEKN